MADLMGQWVSGPIYHHKKPAAHSAAGALTPSAETGRAQAVGPFMAWPPHGRPRPSQLGKRRESSGHPPLPARITLTAKGRRDGEDGRRGTFISKYWLIYPAIL